MSAQQILSGAAAIINAESKWTTKAIARKADGTPCGPLSTFAVRWDIYGAMRKAHADLNLPLSDLHAAMDILREKFVTRNKDVDYFNDRNTYAACITLLTT